MIAAVAMAMALASGAAHGGVHRDAKQVRIFRYHNPCPSTGRYYGPCPGWQVDHREALICGGPDTQDNLQWLSHVEHRAKTRAEVKLCRPRRSPG